MGGRHSTKNKEKKKKKPSGGAVGTDEGVGAVGTDQVVHHNYLINADYVNIGTSTRINHNSKDSSSEDDDSLVVAGIPSGINNSKTSSVNIVSSRLESSTFHDSIIDTKDEGKMHIGKTAIESNLNRPQDYLPLLLTSHIDEEVKKEQFSRPKLLEREDGDGCHDETQVKINNTSRQKKNSADTNRSAQVEGAKTDYSKTEIQGEGEDQTKEVVNDGELDSDDRPVENREVKGGVETNAEIFTEKNDDLVIEVDAAPVVIFPGENETDYINEGDCVVEAGIRKCSKGNDTQQENEGEGEVGAEIVICSKENETERENEDCKVYSEKTHTEYGSQYLDKISNFGKDGMCKKYDIAMKSESNDQVKIESVKEIGATCRSVANNMTAVAIHYSKH